MLRRPLALLGCLLAGAGSAVALAACGEENPGKIPDGQAAALSDSLGDLRASVSDGKCQLVTETLASLENDLEGLSPRVDERLRERLREGLANLRGIAPTKCAQQTETTETTQTTAPVETQPPEPVPTVVPTTTQAPPTVAPETTPEPLPEEPDPEPTDTIIIPPPDGGGEPAPENDGGAVAGGGGP